MANNAVSTMPPFEVVVITGFLGAGKTTLMNALLADPAFRDTAVIVNEFGEIGLDHLTVATARDNIVLLEAGCLCCEMLDSLRETIVDLVQRHAARQIPPFRRILIETSGLADPAPIVHTIRRDPVVAPLLALANVVTLVDALHAAVQLDAHPETAEQIALADIAVVTKLDPRDNAVPTSLEALIARINPAAPILTATTVRARPARLLERGDAPAPVERHHHHALHDQAIRSEAFTCGATDWPGIARWTAELERRWGARLLRVKALLEVDPGGRPVLLDGVRGLYDYRRLDTWPDAQRGGRIVVIGRELDRATLQGTLAALAERRAA